MLALLFLFALGLVIFLHELGHLWMARLLGIRPSQVTFGFGPPLYTARRRGIRFTLGAVPLGGTVELEGENPHRVQPDRGAAGYFAQPPWKRLLILLGGPLTNFLLAPLALLLLYMGGTHVAVPLTVGMVVPGSPAAYAQIRPGDRIIALDGKAIGTWSELTERMAARVDREVAVTLGRPTGAVAVRVTPRADERGAVRIGISQQYVYRVLPFKEALPVALAHASRLAGEELGTAVELIRGGRDVGLSQAGRVVRNASEAAAAGGLDSALRGLAGLSIALGLFYLVPIPALDGGRTLLVLWELATKRRMNPHWVTALQTVGLISFLSLLAWVALSNVRHLQQLVR